MGNTICLRNCYKPRDSVDEVSIRFSEVYPSDSLSRRITFINSNDHEFWTIPEEKQLDRTISYYRGAFALSAQDMRTVEEALTSLKTFKVRIERAAVRSEMQMLKTSLESLGSESPTSPSKRNPRLILEIQKGNIIWTDILKEYTSPYLTIKLVEGTGGNQSVLKEFDTSPAISSASPNWNQVFQHEFISENSDFKSMFFKVTLFFLRKKDNSPVQIGTDQTYSFFELMDQALRLKEMFFKHQNSPGNIVKIAFRVQFIHDHALLFKNLLSAIDFRISELQKATKKSTSLIGSRYEPSQKNSSKNSLYYGDKAHSLIIDENHRYTIQ